MPKTIEREYTVSCTSLMALDYLDVNLTIDDRTAEMDESITTIESSWVLTYIFIGICMRY